MAELSRGTMTFLRLTQTMKKPNEGCLRHKKVHAWPPSHLSSYMHISLQRWVTPQEVVAPRLLSLTYSVTFYLNVVTQHRKVDFAPKDQSEPQQ